MRDTTLPFSEYKTHQGHDLNEGTRAINLVEEDHGLVLEGVEAAEGDAVQILMALVNTNRFPNGSLIAMSWLPQGMAWICGWA